MLFSFLVNLSEIIKNTKSCLILKNFFKIDVYNMNNISDSKLFCTFSLYIFFLYFISKILKEESYIIEES